jgi:hypothetical protein
VSGPRAWLERLRAASRRRRAESVRADREGVRVHDQRGPTRGTLAWADLAEIIAFKRDRWSVDDICLGFRTRNTERWLVADEEMQGWDALQEALRDRFGLDYPGWYAAVVQPPFAPNRTVLWSAQPHSPVAGALAATPTNLSQAGA